MDDGHLFQHTLLEFLFLKKMHIFIYFHQRRQNILFFLIVQISAVPVYRVSLKRMQLFFDGWKVYIFTYCRNKYLLWLKLYLITIIYITTLIITWDFFVENNSFYFQWSFLMNAFIWKYFTKMKFILNKDIFIVVYLSVEKRIFLVRTFFESPRTTEQIHNFQKQKMLSGIKGILYGMLYGRQFVIRRATRCIERDEK